MEPVKPISKFCNLSNHKEQEDDNVDDNLDREIDFQQMFVNHIDMKLRSEKKKLDEMLRKILGDEVTVDKINLDDALNGAKDNVSLTTSIDAVNTKEKNNVKQSEKEKKKSKETAEKSLRNVWAREQEFPTLSKDGEVELFKNWFSEKDEMEVDIKEELYKD